MLINSIYWPCKTLLVVIMTPEFTQEKVKIFLILLKNCENLIAFLAFWEAILHKPLMMRKFQYFVLSSILLGLQKIEKLQVYYLFCFFIRLQTQVHLRKCSIFKNQPGDRKIFYIRDRIFFKLIMQLNF